MPSLLWTSVAFYLYFEIAVTLLLCLPFINPALWKRLFDSQFISQLKRGTKTLFWVVLVILLGLFMESVRQMYSYGSGDTRYGKTSLDAELSRTRNVFRAQRNYYITGFALFLMIVIHRLVVMIDTQATLETKAPQSSSGSGTSAQKKTD